MTILKTLLKLKDLFGSAFPNLGVLTAHVGMQLFTKFAKLFSTFCSTLSWRTKFPIPIKKDESKCVENLTFDVEQELGQRVRGCLWTSAQEFLIPKIRQIFNNFL